MNYCDWTILIDREGKLFQCPHITLTEQWGAESYWVGYIWETASGPGIHLHKFETFDQLKENRGGKGFNLSLVSFQTFKAFIRKGNSPVQLEDQWGQRYGVSYRDDDNGVYVGGPNSEEHYIMFRCEDRAKFLAFLDAVYQ